MLASVWSSNRLLHNDVPRSQHRCQGVALRGSGSVWRGPMISALVPHDVRTVVLDQFRFTFPNSLKRFFKIGDLLKVFREQGDDFIVVNRHKLAHRGLDVFKKFNFNWT